MAKDKKDKFNDLGFGSKGSKDSFRALNKDGSFNVKKTNVPFFAKVNFFHSLISMSWLKFFCVLLIGYIIVNLVFGSLYYIVGVEHLTGIKAASPLDQFLEAFFFSAQTITTLGYGRVAPIGKSANVIAAVESMLGLLSFALATGMLYGRFSRPSAKITYSTKAVIAAYRNMNAFMFRIVNPQNNQLLEVEVNVTLSIRQTGSIQRNFFSLKLERSKVAFLPYTWTIVHPIDEESPLYQLKEIDLIEKDAEFIIMIKAFDESFSQIVYSRSSYKGEELEWGQKFVSAIQPEDNGMKIDVSKLSDTERIELK